MAVVAGLVSVFALVAASLGPAGAVSLTPAFEPDANSSGHVVFYDSSGNVITHGDPGTGFPLSHIAAYIAVDSAATLSGSYTKAHAYWALPDHTLAPIDWSSTSISASTSYPVTAGSAPQSIKDLTTPVVTMSSSDGNIKSRLGGVTLDSTTGYAGMVDVRVLLFGSGTQYAGYYQTVISFNIANDSWEQVYPLPVSKYATTPSTPTSYPAPDANGRIAHDSLVTLSTVISCADANCPAAHPDGTVTFAEVNDQGGLVQSLGQATYDTQTGVASLSVGSAPADGSHYYSASFTPTDTAQYSGGSNDISSSTNPPLYLNVVPLPRSNPSILPGIQGSAAVGKAITCSSGGWSSASSLRYEWYQGASAVAVRAAAEGSVASIASGALTQGGLGSSGVLASSLVGRYVLCKIVATNISGETSAYTTAVKVALGAAAIVGTPKPKITGTAKVGKILTANPGKWTPTATYTYTYQWKRYKAGNKGASVALKSIARKPNQYLAVAADKGKYIFLVVTATRAGYTASTAYITAPVKIA